MKKIFTLLATLIFSATAAMATTFTFNTEADLNQTADGITVKVEKGAGNNAPAFYDNGLRLYASNTITVSAASLRNISLTFAKQGQKDFASMTASNGNLISGGTSTSATDYVTDTWSGTSGSVTFTIGTGQRLFVQLIVNGDGSETIPTPDTPDTPDTPSDLDPDFVYPEPTLIGVPPTTVQGDSYAFTCNNILVSCTKGAVTADYFSAHAGFDMTFTATRPIKGIVINGFVKKGFEATADHGTISYITPSDDKEADPVVVIKDVDATNVTISCVKQLRCYNVEVYFEANPEVSVGGGTTGGEEISLIFDSAEAVYESEYSDMIGELNYSIFLFNEAEPYAPYFALDIYPEEKDVLEGTYTWDDLTLGDFSYYVFGEEEEDLTWVDDGVVTITRNGDLYTVEGLFICDDGNLYTVSFTGSMPIYLDDDYNGDDSGVEEVSAAETVSDNVTYDLSGRRVGKSYRGIVIRNGRKQVQP